MWTKLRKIYILLFVNAAACLVHIEAFQSPLPYLGLLSISLHVLILGYLAGFGRYVLFIFLNMCLVIVHVEAFQSPIPWLAWLSIAIHAYVLMFLFVKNFSRNTKQSKNENL